MAKLDLISNEWTDLVFEGRNQEYGAYKLRKGTTKRNIWSIIIVGLAAVLLYLGLQLQHMVEANRQVENTQAIELSALEQKKKEAKVEKKEQVKVEPEKVVEKVKSSVKFTAPVIKKDNEVKEEDEIKLDEVEKSNKAVGAFTVEGNDEVGGEVLKAKEEIAAPEPPKPVEENKVFDVVEQMPSFPGGMGALMSWLSQNIKYPVIAAENGVHLDSFWTSEVFDESSDTMLMNRNLAILNEYISVIMHAQEKQPRERRPKQRVSPNFFSED